MHSSSTCILFIYGHVMQSLTKSNWEPHKDLHKLLCLNDTMSFPLFLLLDITLSVC